MRIEFLNILTLVFLTLVFVVAKLANVVEWPWWVVFLPTIILTLTLVLTIAVLDAIAKTK